MWSAADLHAAAARRAGLAAAEPAEPPAATVNEPAPSTEEHTLGLPSQLRQVLETAQMAEMADTAAGMAMVVTPLEMPKEQPVLGADKPAPTASEAAPKAANEFTEEKVESEPTESEPAATEERPRDGRRKAEAAAPTADALTMESQESRRKVQADAKPTLPATDAQQEPPTAVPPHDAHAAAAELEDADELEEDHSVAEPLSAAEIQRRTTLDRRRRMSEIQRRIVLETFAQQLMDGAVWG